MHFRRPPTGVSRYVFLRQRYWAGRARVAQELYAKGHDVPILAAYLEVSQAKVHELIQAP